jgi:hypothetical protein
MIVYLAASWSKRPQMQRLKLDLEKSIRGLTVNARWLEVEPVNNWPRPTLDNTLRKLRRQRAEMDREDVEAADIIVRFTDDLSKKMVPSYLATGSRMWEMGYAMRGHQPVIVVGGIQNFFDYLPEVQHVKTVIGLKRALRRIANGEKEAHRKASRTLKRALRAMRKFGA